jgi:hypothetical protein
MVIRKLPTGPSRTETLSGVCFGMKVPLSSMLMTLRESQTSGKVTTKNVDRSDHLRF